MTSPAGEPGDIIVLKSGIIGEDAAIGWADMFTPDHPGARAVRSPDGTWQVIAGGGREQLFGHNTLDEALEEGKLKGITNIKKSDIWVDRFGRFHPSVPDDPKPTGLGIVRESVVGNETLYELENGTIIRQSIDLSITKDFSTFDEARKAAMESGLPLHKAEFFVKDNRWNFKQKEEIADTTTQASFFADTDPVTGQLLLIDRNTGNIIIASEAPKLPPGATVFKADGRTLVRQPNGTITELSRPTQEGAVEIIGGQRFIRQPDGSLQVLGNVSREASIQTSGGQRFIRGTQGGLTPITPLTMEQIINNAIRAGDFEAAVVLDDFRNRPSTTEVLDRALAFAKSPAEAAVISALARGEGALVNQAFQQGRESQQAGEVRRVGPQPGFLQDAFDDFLASTEAGSLDPAADFLQSIDPLTEQKLRQQEEIHQLKIAGMTQANTTAASLDSQKIETGTVTGGNIPPAEPVLSPIDQARADALEAGIPQAEIDEFVSGLLIGRLTPDDVAGKLQGKITREADAAAAEARELALESTTSSLQQELETSGGAATQSVQDLFNELRAAAGKDPFEFDALAEGGVTSGSNLEIVGEGGEPELVDLPPGTVVTPISKLTDEQVEELKAKGVKGLAHGGVSDSTFPLGIEQLLGGGRIEPDRSIFPVAGLTVPSAQAQRRLLPLELEFLAELGAQAGIPEAEFTRELQRQGPGRGGGRGVFAPTVRLR